MLHMPGHKALGLAGGCRALGAETRQALSMQDGRVTFPLRRDLQGVDTIHNEGIKCVRSTFNLSA